MIYCQFNSIMDHKVMLVVTLFLIVKNDKIHVVILLFNYVSCYLVLLSPENEICDFHSSPRQKLLT